MMDDESLLISESESTPIREENSDEDQVDDENDLYVEETQKNFKRIGITQLVLGIVSITLGIILSCTSWHCFEQSVPGVWCGIFVLISGSLAITLNFHLNQGVVIANLVASILASIFGLVLVILTAVPIFDDRLSVALESVFSCIVAVAWTTLCVYHAIIVARILVQNKAMSRPVCCLGNYPPSYPGMTMAYVPGSRLPDGNQTVFMAVPANSSMHNAQYMMPHSDTSITQ